MIINSMTNQTASFNGTKQTEEKESGKNSFASELENSENKKTAQEEKEERQMLTDDIFSLLKNGLTKSELEELEKLIDEIKKKMKEENPNEIELAKLMKALEHQIALFQKRISGESTVETQNNTTQTVPPSFDVIMQIQEQIKSSAEQFNELQAGAFIKSNAHTTEELELLKKFQHKN